MVSIKVHFQLICFSEKDVHVVKNGSQFDFGQKWPAAGLLKDGDETNVVVFDVAEHRQVNFTEVTHFNLVFLFICIPQSLQI